MTSPPSQKFSGPASLTCKPVCEGTSLKTHREFQYQTAVLTYNDVCSFPVAYCLSLGAPLSTAVPATVVPQMLCSWAVPSPPSPPTPQPPTPVLLPPGGRNSGRVMPPSQGSFSILYQSHPHSCSPPPGTLPAQHPLPQHPHWGTVFSPQTQTLNFLPPLLFPERLLP